MSPDEMQKHFEMLEQATRLHKRRLTGLECWRMGILLYESKKECARHGHNIKRFGSFACPECENERSKTYKEMSRLETAGLVTKIKKDGRVMWIPRTNDTTKEPKT